MTRLSRTIAENTDLNRRLRNATCCNNMTFYDNLISTCLGDNNKVVQGCPIIITGGGCVLVSGQRDSPLASIHPEPDELLTFYSWQMISPHLSPPLPCVSSRLLVLGPRVLKPLRAVDTANNDAWHSKAAEHTRIN